MLCVAAQFSEGDLIMKKGEEASWAGVLLSGELEALLPSGQRPELGFTQY